MGFLPDQMLVKTISGVEEGRYALVAANFFALHANFTDHLPRAVMDLGGSSTQIVVPLSMCVRKDGICDDIWVKSFSNYGMEMSMQILEEELLNRETRQLWRSANFQEMAKHAGISLI